MGMFDVDEEKIKALRANILISIMHYICSQKRIIVLMMKRGSLQRQEEGREN